MLINPLSITVRLTTGEGPKFARRAPIEQPDMSVVVLFTAREYTWAWKIADPMS
jgi:hypothetical protein